MMIALFGNLTSSFDKNYLSMGDLQSERQKNENSIEFAVFGGIKQF